MKSVDITKPVNLFTPHPIDFVNLFEKSEEEKAALLLFLEPHWDDKREERPVHALDRMIRDIFTKLVWQ